MTSYTKVDVSEQRLEDLVRHNAGELEEGLAYVDHQKPAAGGRLDILMVDVDRSLVLAELKVIQDDGMLVQALDYYDYVSSHVEAYARLYKNHSIDPTRPVRLFLVAPDFSQTLVNRCKWLKLPISLFTYSVLKFENDNEMVPIFTKRELPAEPPEVVEVSHVEDILAYIVDVAVRGQASSLLDEIKDWGRPGKVTVDPIKDQISIKVNNRVFAYLWAARKHYVVATYGDDDEWKHYPIKGDEDFTNAKQLMRKAMERRSGITPVAIAAGTAS